MSYAWGWNTVKPVYFDHLQYGQHNSIRQMVSIEQDSCHTHYSQTMSSPPHPPSACAHTYRHCVCNTYTVLHVCAVCTRDTQEDMVILLLMQGHWSPRLPVFQSNVNTLSVSETYNFQNLVWPNVRPTQVSVGHDRTRPDINDLSWESSWSKRTYVIELKARVSYCGKIEI